jgi:hypothetical protein
MKNKKKFKFRNPHRFLSLLYQKLQQIHHTQIVLRACCSLLTTFYYLLQFLRLTWLKRAKNCLSKIKHLFFIHLTVFLCKMLIWMSYLGVKKENYLFVKGARLWKFAYLADIHNWYFYLVLIHTMSRISQWWTETSRSIRSFIIYKTHHNKGLR